MTQLWDPIRSLWVAKTPEEIVRQFWITRMIGELGFPKGLLGVERELASFLTPEEGRGSPNRRLDIVGFWTEGSSLHPLLLIECKREKRGRVAEEQLLGYNRLIRAPFLSLVERESARTIWFEKGERKEVPFLPHYSELLSYAHTR